MVETEYGRLLVDTPPELRLQLLAAGVDSVDAIWFTHVHADHVHGIDDVRVFTIRHGDMPAYVAGEYVSKMQDHFEYIFNEACQPPRGSSKPRIEIKAFEAGTPVHIVGRDFTPLLVPHGDCSVYGFRVGKLGYITDGKTLPAETVDVLKGVDVLVLNALWFGHPHASHFNVEEAIEAGLAVGAKHTYLTHLTHRVTHGELVSRLPEGFFPAYDGLVVDVK